jgi:hypothetical protein
MARTASTLPGAASGPWLMEPDRQELRWLPSAGQPAQFLPVGLGLRIKVCQPDARLRAAHTAAHPAKGVVARQVQDHAAVQWRALAVVAGAAAAHGEGNARTGACCYHLADFLFGAWAHGDVAALARQVAFEHGAEPGKVL